MNERKYPKEEIMARGKAIYEEKLKPLLEPEHTGKFLIVDIETGDYEMDNDEFAASKRAHEKHPDGAFLGMRVGYRAVGTLGASRASLRR